MKLKIRKRKPIRRITIFQSPSHLWYFHVQGDNAEVIAASEGYKQRTDMMNTLNRYFPEWDIIEDEDRSDS